jgi:hypothetical protein
LREKRQDFRIELPPQASRSSPATVSNAPEGEARLRARIRFDNVTRPPVDAFGTILRF